MSAATMAKNKYVLVEIDLDEHSSKPPIVTPHCLKVRCGSTAAYFSVFFWNGQITSGKAAVM